MIRDWAGLEDASDEASEGDAGPGDDGSSAAGGTVASAKGVDGLVFDKEPNRCLLDCVRSAGGLVPVRSLEEPTVLPDDEVRAAGGGVATPAFGLLPEPTLGVGGRLESFFDTEISLRMVSDEGALP